MRTLAKFEGTPQIPMKAFNQFRYFFSGAGHRASIRLKILWTVFVGTAEQARSSTGLLCFPPQLAEDIFTPKSLATAPCLGSACEGIIEAEMDEPRHHLRPSMHTANCQRHMSTAHVCTCLRTHYFIGPRPTRRTTSSCDRGGSATRGGKSGGRSGIMPPSCSAAS